MMKYAEVIAYTNSSANSNYRYYGKALNESSIIIGNTAIDELFDTLENKTVLITREYEKQRDKNTSNTKARCSVQVDFAELRKTRGYNPRYPCRVCIKFDRV